MEWACEFMPLSLVRILPPRPRNLKAKPFENGNKTQVSQLRSGRKPIQHPGVPNLFSPGNAKGAPGLAFETWDPPSKGQSSPAFTPTASKKRIPPIVKGRHIKRGTAEEAAEKPSIRMGAA